MNTDAAGLPVKAAKLEVPTLHGLAEVDGLVIAVLAVHEAVAEAEPAYANRTGSAVRTPEIGSLALEVFAQVLVLVGAVEAVLAAIANLPLAYARSSDSASSGFFTIFSSAPNMSKN